MTQPPPPPHQPQQPPAPPGVTSGATSGGESGQPRTMAYPELHRAGRNEWWRAILGLCTVALLGFVVLGLLVIAVLSLVVFVSGYGAERFNEELSRFPEDLTPMSLAFGLLSVWCLIPAVWVAQRLIHWLPFGSLNSVTFRFRWRYFTASLGLAVIALLITLGVSSLLPATAVSGAPESSLNDLTATAWQFLVVVVLLVPIQAAAEEYAFRGYLMQVWGGVFGGRRFATVASIVASALIFAFMHGSQELPIFFDRFAFGVCAGVVVVLTGGLEAAIALHVVNNFFAFGIATLFGDVTAAMTPSGSSWWQIPVSLVQVGTFGALAVWLARRQGLATTVDLVPGSQARTVGSAPS